LIQKVVLKIDGTDSDILNKLATVKEICEKNKGGTPIDFEVLLESEGKRRELRLFARRMTIESENDVLDALARAIGSDAVRISA
jgi:hypothetical protein